RIAAVSGPKHRPVHLLLVQPRVLRHQDKTAQGGTSFKNGKSDAQSLPKPGAGLHDTRIDPDESRHKRKVRDGKKQRLPTEPIHRPEERASEWLVLRAKNEAEGYDGEDLRDQKRNHTGCD